MSQHQIHLREHTVPGVGRVYEMPLDDTHVLSLAIDARSGERTVAVLGPSSDEPDLEVRLDEAQAATIAFLMGGVRVESEGGSPRSGVQVDTVVVASGSPVVGHTLASLQADSSIGRPHPEDARVIAVIRDDTPELLEADPHRPCQPGDRLVLAGRPGAMDELRRWILG